jgi:hypothetical protein
MPMESCDTWMRRGLIEGQWFPGGVSYIQLLTHESCGPLLPWLKKIWQKQGASLQFFSASVIDSIDLDVFLEVYSLQSSSILVMIMDIEPSRKLYNHIMERCSRYQGPHRIVLIVLAQHKAVYRNAVVELPKYIDYNFFTTLYLLINGNLYEKLEIKAFFGAMYRLSTKLTLAQVCLVIPYIHVLGRGRDQFFRYWLPPLIHTTPSLFTLSQQLLSRDASAFYTTWQRLYARYPDEFWLVYWSDQFWQAYCFIISSRTSGLDQSTIFAKGLPFAFVQRGWRLYKAELFVELIEVMYEYDCYTKQGGLMVPYDLLFNKILIEQPK